MPSPRQIEVLRRAVKLEESLRARLSANWLASSYKNFLYGGWRHHDGRWIDKPHKPAIAIHEAFKALFCPECYRPIGTAPKIEETYVSCPEHGKMHWRAAFSHRTVLACIGNRGGKDFSMASEFCSWPIGKRPWDGTLTCPPKAGRRWLVVCESRSSVGMSLICPYIQLRLGDEKNGGWITDAIRTTGKIISYFVLKNGQFIDVMSHEQYSKSPADTNPFEGHNWHGVWMSEPPPEGLRTAVMRGITSARSEGWGREAIAATPLTSGYLYNEVFQRAWNMGGDARHIAAIKGTIWDNPSLSDREIQEYLADIPHEFREARAKGTFLFLSGLVFPQFCDLHITDWDPLFQDGEASSWPVICSIDPHDDRPWFMQWWAISPRNDWYLVREWPEEDFFLMRHDHRGLDDYAEIVKGMENALPGGARRVIARTMDPRFGRGGKAGIKPLVEEMVDRGLYFETEGLAEEIEPGHSRIRTLLNWDRKQPVSDMNRPHAFIGQHCRNTIRALRNYTFVDPRNPERNSESKPNERYKDPIDSWRYALALQPVYTDWRGGDDYLRQRLDEIRSVQETY
jgi:hypothetical protein